MGTLKENIIAVKESADIADYIDSFGVPLKPGNPLMAPAHSTRTQHHPSQCTRPPKHTTVSVAKNPETLSPSPKKWVRPQTWLKQCA